MTDEERLANELIDELKRDYDECDWELSVIKASEVKKPLFLLNLINNLEEKLEDINLKLSPSMCFIRGVANYNLGNFKEALNDISVAEFDDGCGCTDATIEYYLAKARIANGKLAESVKPLTNSLLCKEQNILGYDVELGDEEDIEELIETLVSKTLETPIEKWRDVINALENADEGNSRNQFETRFEKNFYEVLKKEAQKLESAYDTRWEAEHSKKGTTSPQGIEM